MEIAKYLYHNDWKSTAPESQYKILIAYLDLPIQYL